jgi:hypothetical protein
MSLYKDSSVLYHSYTNQVCGQSRDIALALQSLGRLSTGKLVGIELQGNVICGLIAAMGNWMFDLDVEIRHDNELLYRSTSFEKPVQIVVCYGTNDNRSDTTQVQVAARSYHVCNISTILREDVYDYARHSLKISGRVSWNNVIQSVFGQTGKSLLRERTILSHIVGIAAEAFKLTTRLKLAESSNWTREIWHVIDIKNGHGAAFIRHITSRFPELAGLDYTVMERYAKESLENLSRSFEDVMKQLREQCTCSSCYSTNLPNSSCCLVWLPIYIVNIARNLAFIIPDADIEPYRSGFESIYFELVPSFTEREWQLTDLFKFVTSKDVYKTAIALYTGNSDLATINELAGS